MFYQKVTADVEEEQSKLLADKLNDSRNIASTTFCVYS